MFGALNRFISRLDAEPQQQNQSSGGEGSYGFQVLRNTNADTPIEPWFDFIIGINGHLIVCEVSLEKYGLLTGIAQDDPDPNLFATEVRNCAGSSVSLELWSAKVCQCRVVTDYSGLGQFTDAS